MKAATENVLPMVLLFIFPIGLNRNATRGTVRLHFRGSLIMFLIQLKNAARNVSIILLLLTDTVLERLTRPFLPLTDFANSKKCGITDVLKFYPDYNANECSQKLLSEFEPWENEIYDSLHACCSDKFPNSITTCCDSDGAGGCVLSGDVKWLPDWANGHCFEKVS